MLYQWFYWYSLSLAYGVAKADDTHAMTKEQLLPLLGKSDVIIIDVSSNEGWESRDRKDSRGPEGRAHEIRILDEQVPQRQDYHPLLFLSER